MAKKAAATQKTVKKRTAKRSAAKTTKKTTKKTARKSTKKVAKTLKPIRLAIWGIGRAGWSMHCSELKGKEKMFQIVACCDPIKERRDMMAEKYDCATYIKPEDMLADENIEMVSIATRSRDHFKHAMMALKAGKDVFLEKPITLTYKEAHKLRCTANMSKANLYIRHNRRFEPCFQHIREIIDSGILGDVFEVKLRRVQYQRRDDWQTIKCYGGGQLLNWGPHIIDHGLQLLDSPVKDLWSDLKTVAAAGNAEDHLKIIMKGKNGRLVDLEISGGAAIKEPEYLIWGTRGALSATGDDIELRYLDPRQKLKDRKANPDTPPVSGGFGSAETLKWVEKKIKVKPQKKVDMTLIWDELYDTVRNGSTFPISLDEAVAVMDIVSRVKAGTKYA